MTVEITFDMTQFKKALSKSPDAITKGLKTGLKDIKNDWQADAVDIAPIYKKENYPEDKKSRGGGTLRSQIDAKVNDLSVEITANAMREGFNYAYYIHEQDAGGKKLREPGTEKKFLDVSAKQNEDKWAKWLEEEIADELKKVGWR